VERAAIFEVTRTAHADLRNAFVEPQRLRPRLDQTSSRATW
jgi:hypothetical protein